MKKIKLLTLILIFSATLTAQNNNMTGHLGYANFFNKKATGFSMGFDYSRKIGSKHFVGIGLSYTMTERRGILPSNLDKSNVIYRDFSYQADSISGFVWTKESFPKFHLTSKPDKYFNFNVSLNYNYTVWENNKQSFKIGMGIVGTFNDELELVEFVEGKSFRARIIVVDTKDFQIAVFQYDTYLDLGFVPQIAYNYQLNERMSIGLSNKYYCYPKSSRYVSTFSTFINFNF